MATKRKTSRAEQADHFTKMIRTTMEAPAWRALSTTAQALYPWLKLEWRGPKANNNGRIRLSVRDAAERLGVKHPDTAARAFQELQAKGFLVLTEHAVLGIEGVSRPPAYELTELALPHGDKADGRKLYRDWRPGADFPVHKARAHNPRGANGKAKSHPKKEDGSVLIFRTDSRRSS